MVTRYEDLRHQALATSFFPIDHGLALLLHRGMASWIKAWMQFKPKKEGIPRTRPPQKAIPISTESRLDLVRLLASMALGC
jgi:hypothetical protein